MTSHRKRFGGKMRIGNTTFNLGRIRKQKIPKLPRVPNPRTATHRSWRRSGGGALRFTLGRRRSLVGVGGLLLLLVALAIIGHATH
jgi:hypothetical protein